MPNKNNLTRANNALKKLPTKKAIEQSKKDLLKYLSYEYGITFFNKFFVSKLGHIHEGVLQNLQVPITYTELHDMFKFFKHHLDEQLVRYKESGRQFSDAQGRLNYDLIIVLNKHPEYLTALEQEKIKATEREQPQQQSVVSLVDAPVQQQSEIDISTMLDDW